jgi:hypothetical protein
MDQNLVNDITKEVKRRKKDKDKKDKDKKPPKYKHPVLSPIEMELMITDIEKDLCILI